MILLEKNSVCAIIVSYNCDAGLYKNIDSVYQQAGHICIVDNGSNAETIRVLNKFKNDAKISIIKNNDNKGIAFALNQGLDFASSNNYDLILTLDQDSVLHRDAVEKMLFVLNNNSRIISVGPNLYNYNKEESFLFVEELISSGNLTYTSSAKSVDGFRTDLFIDCVDTFFSFDLRNESNNNKLAIVKDAYMEHNLGELTLGRFLFFKRKLDLHSSVRHYYMSRNSHYLQMVYGTIFPDSCKKIQITYLKYFLLVLFFFGNKRENYKMIRKGIKDAKNNKFGNYQTK
jgi:rhamnosyltransferase